MQIKTPQTNINLCILYKTTQSKGLSQSFIHKSIKYPYYLKKLYEDAQQNLCIW